MKHLVNKAQTLVEALPYIKQFHGKTVVIKYGGSIGQKDLSAFAEDLLYCVYVGIKPVVVHGGGVQIAENLAEQNIETETIAGQRVTDAKTIKVVEMVLMGKVNQEIITAINRHGGKAVGLSGKGGGLIKARKIDMERLARQSGLEIPQGTDLGMVGEVARIDCDVIRRLAGASTSCKHEGDMGYIPVIAPIGIDEGGKTYNINADHVASQMAGALQASRLIMLTNVAGILDENKELISSLTETEARELMRTGIISQGMIPKVTCALDALHEGVEKVHVINGHKERALLLELFTDAGIGTEITL